MRFITYKDVWSQLAFHFFLLLTIGAGLFWFNSYDVKSYLFFSLLVSFLSFGNLKLFYLGDGRSEFYRSNQYSLTNLNRRITFEMIIFITPFIIIESFVFNNIFPYYFIAKLSLSILIANSVIYKNKFNIFLTFILMLLIVSELNPTSVVILVGVCALTSLIYHLFIVKK